MNYPGDQYVFTLVIQHSDGTNPTITSAPTISIVNAITGTALVTGAAMALITGTTYVYTYSWNSTGAALGTYVGLVSYVADGHAINNQFLERVKLGDTYVTGTVAQDATVAKDLTVAKDATVMHRTDYVSPDNSVAVQSILNQVTNLPNQFPTQAQYNQQLSLIQDVWDSVMGSWAIDKVQSTLTLFRKAGGQLAKFALSNSNTQSGRTTS